jgi:hypothetical protein
MPKVISIDSEEEYKNILAFLNTGRKQFPEKFNSIQRSNLKI